MKGLLGKLPLVIKGVALTAVATAAVTFLPPKTKTTRPIEPTEPEKPVPRMIGDFTYHTEVTNVSAINTQSNPRQGLKQATENGVTSVGNHSIPDPNEAEYAIYVSTSIDNTSEAITVTHSHQPKSKSKKIERVGEHLTEDANNTHTYLIVPKEVKIGHIDQTIRRVNTKRPEGFSVGTVPTKDSELNAKIRKYNRLFTNKSDPGISELEKAVRNSAKLLGGKKGKVIEFGIDGFKRVLEKNEVSRRDFLEKKYGKGYQVIKAPLHVSNEKELGSNPIGRTTIFETDTSELKEQKEGYVEIRKITLSKGSRRAGLEKLAYKFMIKKGGPTRINPISLDNTIVLGSWEPIGTSYYNKTRLSITPRTMRKTDLKTGKVVSNNIRIIGEVDDHMHVTIWSFDNTGRTIILKGKDIMYSQSQMYKREGVPIQRVSTIEKLYGEWESVKKNKFTREEYTLSGNQFRGYTNGKLKEDFTVEFPVLKIGETHILLLKNKDNEKDYVLITPTGENKTLVGDECFSNRFTRKK